MGPHKKPASFIQYLNRRIVLAGLILITISVTGFLVLDYYTRISQSDALRINMAGKQRMLLEQSVMYSYRIASLSRPDEIRQAQQALASNLLQLNNSHQALIHGSQDGSIKKVRTPHLEQLYFQDDQSIDPRLTRFIAEATLLTNNQLSSLPAISQIRQLDFSVNPGLLNQLDQAVKEYETISKQHTQHIWQISLVATLSSIIMVIIVYRFLLHPSLQGYQNSLHLHDTLLENSLDIILICSENHIIVDCNQQAEQALDITTHSTMITDLSLPEYSATIGIVQGSHQQTLLLHGHKQCDVEIRYTRIPVPGKHYYAVFIRDISDQILYQQELIIQKESAVAAMAEARQANQAKSEFLASVSHEFRTPLNAIMGFAQLMTDDKELPCEYQDFAQEIIQSGQHLLHLVNNILEYGKIESGKLECHVQAISPVSLIQQAIEIMLPIAEQAEIQLEKNRLPPLPDLRVDPLFLKQILINLLSNAIKYNSSGGWVRLTTEQEEGYLKIQVEDNGHGIELAEHRDLFLPFNREGHKNSYISGTGVGLSICKYMIEQMKGDIDYRSIPGKGSTFWVRLPLARIAFES
ncbi:ATP-binding protein [Oceanospirillum sediminis]|uniref:histidine kinase n=1 Tax=Oceanospirillum sediminis TaxID=2760088 RepID=A0A839IVP1_9GAMM|nr:ATP-binding protein [Oceanospirillum sediminis]MBB1488467.1 type IV pili methyl-accepting chemotaxis transducer N-terminal domain-containing protein [Oceanospirillum sediminis]